MKVDEKPLTLPLRFDMIDMLGSLYPDFYMQPLSNLTKSLILHIISAIIFRCYTP